MIRKFAEWYCGYYETVIHINQKWQLEISDVRDKLDEAKLTCEALEEKCRYRQEKIDSMEMSLDAIKRAKEAIENECAHAKEACKAKQAEIDSLDSKNRFLLNEKANHTIAIDNYAKKIAALESRCRILAHPVSDTAKKRGRKKKISSTSVEGKPANK